MSYMNCICGKDYDLLCSLNCCKKCCKTKYCLTHSPTNLLTLSKNTCFMCDTKHSIDDLTFLDDTLNYCNNCYEENTLLIDKNNKLNMSNQIFKQIKCSCGNNRSEACALKCCKKCCKALGCTKHKNENTIVNNDTCTICMKQNKKLNSYLNDKNNIVTYYCDNCYKTNNVVVNRMLSIKPVLNTNMLFGCNIRTIKEDMEDRFNVLKDMTIEEALFKTFMKKYKDKAITTTIFKKHIYTHKYFNIDCFQDCDYEYKCPCCKHVDDIFFTSLCCDCDTLICTAYECNVETDNDVSYCKKCYDKHITETYIKYKDVTLTKDIVLSDNFTFNMDDAYRLENLLQYKCPCCNVIKSFASCNLAICEDCNAPACHDCLIEVTLGCGVPNCPHCSRGYCANSSYIISCDTCYRRRMHGTERERRSISPSVITDDPTKQCNVCMTNVKNYCFAPCGHLCICGECSIKVVNKCPVCMDNVTGVIRVFN